MKTLFFENAASAAIPEKLFNLWMRLAAGTGQADPVCCGPAWQLAWHAACTPRRPFMLVTSGANLAAFSFNLLEKGTLVLLPLEAEWFFGQPLLGMDAVDLLAAVFLEARRLASPAWSMALVSGVQPDSPFRNRLFSASRRLSRYGKFVECAASLENGLEGWLSRRSANHRAKLKKALRKGRDAGLRFTRHIPASAMEADILFDQMLAIEEKSWKGLSGTGMTMTQPREFYREFMRRQAPLGTVRVILASIGSQPIGYIFGSVLGSAYRGQQFSYDQDYASLSIGNLMQFKKVEWLCEEGLARYDMGPITGPKMQYKEHWTEIRLPVESWFMSGG